MTFTTALPHCRSSELNKQIERITQAGFYTYLLLYLLLMYWGKTEDLRTRVVSFNHKLQSHLLRRSVISKAFGINSTK